MTDTQIPKSRSVMNFSAGHNLPKSNRRISLRSDFAMMSSPSPTDAERIEVYGQTEYMVPEKTLSINLSANSLAIPVFESPTNGTMSALQCLQNKVSDNKSYGAVNIGAVNIDISENHGTKSFESDRSKIMKLRKSARKYGRVFQKIRHLILACWLSFCFTFMWFPGLIVEIPSSFAVINENGNWLPIILIFEFNVFDYVGRQFLCNVIPSWLTQHDLWKLSICRSVLYPIFVIFFRQFIVSDVILHCVMIISALSNGYVASLSFMWFPKNVKKGSEQQIAASLMTLGLIMGILSGSTLAIILQPVISMGISEEI